MVSEGTQQLLEDVFQNPALFRGLRRIRRRIVAWGAQDPIALPHSGIVVPEQELLNRLGSPEAQPNDLLPDWTIYTGGPLPEPSTAPRFGSRTATATFVRLSAHADPEACVMESVDQGWLFVLPINDNRAILLTAGASVSELLAESALIQPSIDCLLEEAGSFPSHPRLADPLCGNHWLACGTAAIGFDPLCGDGSGHAVREAVLACAIVSHASPSTSTDELLWEYRLRLWRGFRRHLELCLHYYATGGQSDWWQTQCESLQQSLHWISGLHAPHSLGRFQLNGYTLERVAQAHSH
jgi:hypothetical protein